MYVYKYNRPACLQSGYSSVSFTTCASLHMSMFTNNALLGGEVRVKVWIREQRKIKRRSKALLSKPLMATSLLCLCPLPGTPNYVSKLLKSYVTSWLPMIVTRAITTLRSEPGLRPSTSLCLASSWTTTSICTRDQTAGRTGAPRLRGIQKSGGPWSSRRAPTEDGR